MEQAVALDPSFAAAHAGLARAYLLQMQFSTDSGGLLKRAGASVTRAMALDSTIVESRLASFHYHYSIDDAEGAYREMQAAERIAPQNPDVLIHLGNALIDLGRVENAIPFFQRAEQIEPRWISPPAYLLTVYKQLSRYEEAIRAGERALILTAAGDFHDLIQAEARLLWNADTIAARRVLESGPNRPAMDELTRLPSPWAGRAIWRSILPRAVLLAKDTISRAGYVRGDWGTRELYHVMKARHFTFTGRTERGRAHADSAIALLEPLVRRGELVDVLFGFFPTPALLAECYAYRGRTADAARTIDQFIAVGRKAVLPRKLARYLPMYLVHAAYVDAAIGRRDLAVARLEEAMRRPVGAFISPALLRADPSWAPLHGHLGYERLIAAAR